MANGAPHTTGFKEADAALTRLIDGLRAAGGSVTRVGSAVAYAPVQEARRGYLAGAVPDVQRHLPAALAKALPAGAPAVREAIAAVAADAARIGQARSPVKTGNLRRSIHSVRIR